MKVTESIDRKNEIDVKAKLEMKEKKKAEAGVKEKVKHYIDETAKSGDGGKAKSGDGGKAKSGDGGKAELAVDGRVSKKEGIDNNKSKTGVVKRDNKTCGKIETLHDDQQISLSAETADDGIKGVTKEMLAKKLVEKHTNFIKNYKKEFDILERISVLKEKQDQLEYWLCSDNDPNEYQKHLRDMEVADRELLNLNSDLMKVHDSPDSTGSKNSTGDSDSGNGNNISDKPKVRYNWLKQQILRHEDSMDYWNGRYNDLIKAGGKN